ncbi:FBP domain-containing protein [Brevibacterium sp.]|uniref:FBP domain-containing protein n=1 Tax=Brevibacterium sp. TaxID=1701 RepID=UPI002811AD6D|nr:FBP domain-containing protein [Brevibacterium sp.]
MKQLTENQVKKSFVNASRREVEKIRIPDHLAEADWSNREYIGWTDPKIPQRAYVIVSIDEVPHGLVLRSTPSAKSQAMCNWCEDIHELGNVKMFVAKKAGSSGRNGNTLGTLIHGDFNCSELVRTPPRAVEGQNDPEAFIARRVATLSEHAETFVRRIIGSK